MTVDGSQERDRGQAETSAHAQAQASHDASVAASELLEAWSEFAPSFPAMVSKSQQLVAAVSQIGQSIGDFEVRRLLGQGAFGKVFLARQVSLDRDIALKVTANFGNEGRTMARLEHARIVQVFSENVDEKNNLRLLCMQYVPGATLRQIIQRLRELDRDQRDGEAILGIIDQLSSQAATLDPAKLRDREALRSCRFDEAVCWLGQQMAEALAYAHGQGVLHRDIKPANVIVNQYGQPMLTDFNLSFESTDLANIGSAVFGGTLGYMAPEHLDAFNPHIDVGPEVVDERSDVYSLGAVLLDLIGCATPPSVDVTADEFGNMVTVSPRNVDDVIKLLGHFQAPSPLAHVVRRCLDPDPDQRYDTAAHLAEALDGCRQLLRVERAMPRGGKLSHLALSRPLLFMLLFTVVPNLAASMLNLAYITFSVNRDLTPFQQATFAWMVVWYNAVIIALLSILVYRLLISVARLWPKWNAGLLISNVDAQSIRQRTLKLPNWAVVLNCFGWLTFVPVIPLGMELLAGPIDRGVLWHISVSFFVTGMIAVAYNYFVISFVVLRVMYTRIWADAFRFGRTSVDELTHIPSRNRLFQIVAGLTPLGAATLLVLVGPEQFTVESFQRFRVLLAVLIAAGVAGFWLATTGTSVLNSCVAALTGADVNERATKVS